MKYENITTAKFIERCRRFLAHVYDGKKFILTNIKNSSSCDWLLTPDCTVYISKNNNKNRLTAYDIVAVQKDDNIINIDYQVPNKLVASWLKTSDMFSKTAKIYREKNINDNKFDFVIEDNEITTIIDVKGVTKLSDKTAFFPVNKTDFGLKHIEDIILKLKQGHNAILFLIVQTDCCNCLELDSALHKEYYDLLKQACKLGLQIYAMNCKVSDNSIELNEKIPIKI